MVQLPENHYILNGDILQKVLNYLTSQPFSQVNQVIQDIIAGALRLEGSPLIKAFENEIEDLKKQNAITASVTPAGGDVITQA